MPNERPLQSVAGKGAGSDHDFDLQELSEDFETRLDEDGNNEYEEEEEAMEMDDETPHTVQDKGVTSTIDEATSAQHEVPTAKKPKQRKDKENEKRAPGRTQLPLARVQKIIKADKEIPIVAKEATLLISIATEEFIQNIVESCYVVAQRERRSTVQYRDFAHVVRRVDEYLFLEELLPWISADPAPKRPKPANAKLQKGGIKEGELPKSDGKLDGFLAKAIEHDAEEDTEDVIMNEDGTMETPAGLADDIVLPDRSAD